MSLDNTEPIQSESNLIFVYGSLRKGFPNHYFLEQECQFIGLAKSVEKYSMTANEFIVRFGAKRAIPFVSKEPETEIMGEIYDVPNNVLKLLDLLEKHPYWYKREQVDLELVDQKDEEGNPKIINAWLYFNEVDMGEIKIESGDFSVHYPPRKL